ncbi:unnamed protein product [Gadus morhua 'NCC']
MWRAVWASQICLRARIADDMAEPTSRVIWARADKAKERPRRIRNYTIGGSPVAIAVPDVGASIPPLRLNPDWVSQHLG